MEATPPGAFESLRRLLLRPELEALKELRDPERWEEQVAQVLPGALVRRLKQDRALQYALAPLLEETFAQLVRRNPGLLVEILFPVLLPAIRRAVASLFAALTQSLNQTLEQVLSPQGLRWRLEALSTGRSFAEVVLSHTLLYQVEQVLLIHRESGLLLAHVVGEGVQVQDGVLVSGMLTAISDFVRDSFDPSAGLNTVNFGERVLVVEQGPRALLAAVVRGTPPPGLAERLGEVLAEVHTRFVQELRHYDGDNRPFQQAHGALEGLLETQFKPRPSTRPYAAWLVGGLGVALLLLLGLGHYRDERAWRAYLQRLESTPGIMVVEAPRRYELRGLRDPLAPDPKSLLAGLPLKAERIRAHWQPYQSLEPEMVQKRIRERLDTPPTVHLAWREGVLVVSGQSTEAWIGRLRNLAPLLGVERLDTSGLRVLPQ
ncbi:OmpA family protein [Meiothermus sp. QL-1]|uniref:OmpA family protein n=1 Tax=Meiothermus sp. QL-1 TaxID=2058095 RepID=UPI001314A178|nr:OmpA family protein [Meiothermus sp. QL-1]